MDCIGKQDILSQFLVRHFLAVLILIGFLFFVRLQCPVSLSVRQDFITPNISSNIVQSTLGHKSVSFHTHVVRRQFRTGVNTLQDTEHPVLKITSYICGREIRPCFAIKLDLPSIKPISTLLRQICGKLSRQQVSHRTNTSQTILSIK